IAAQEGRGLRLNHARVEAGRGAAVVLAVPLGVLERAAAVAQAVRERLGRRLDAALALAEAHEPAGGLHVLAQELGAPELVRALLAAGQDVLARLVHADAVARPIGERGRRDGRE